VFPSVLLPMSCPPSICTFFPYTTLFRSYASVDASIGQSVWNQGFHWAHLDFLSKDVDQVGKSVATAKPIGYYWRTSPADGFSGRSEEHTSELQSRVDLVCRLLLEKKKNV